MKVPFTALALVLSAFGWTQPAVHVPMTSQDSIAWGPTVKGLRLGIAFGVDHSEPTLRIALRNAGRGSQVLVVGHECAGGPIYDSMTFIATGRDGKEQEFLHRGVYIPIAGLVVPISIRLNAGATYQR